MAEQNDATSSAQAPATGNNQGNNSSAYDDVFMYYKNNEKTKLPRPFAERGRRTNDAFERSMEVILNKFPSLLAYETQGLRDVEFVEESLSRLTVEADDIECILDERTKTLLVRQTLIDHNYGNITTGMIANQRSWMKWLARVQTSQGHVEKGLNWLDLWMEDYIKRSEIFPRFWDAYRERDESTLRSLSFVIAGNLLIRKDFIEVAFDGLTRKFGRVYKTMPDWIQWNVVS